MVGVCSFSRERHCKQSHLQELFSFSEGGCSGSDLGSGLFHTTGTVNLTVSSITMERAFQSSGQNTEVFRTFCQFLTLSFSFFSEHRNANSSALARQGWWPFQPCSSLDFCLEHLAKTGTQVVFHTLQL